MCKLWLLWRWLTLLIIWLNFVVIFCVVRFWLVLLIGFQCEGWWICYPLSWSNHWFCCARLPDNQECHELRYKRLRKGLKDATKMPADNQHHSSASSSDVKYTTEKSCGSHITEHKETSSSSHGAGIAMLLDPGSRRQQQQQAARGTGSLHKRLAEVQQSISSIIDTQSAATVNTDLAALLSVLTAAICQPTQK